MYCLLGKLFQLTRKSWHMYLVEFLFGLGFDTATEIGLLGLSAGGASAGIAIWSIMVFPALFVSGMALVDALDNMMMINTYGLALNKLHRKLYYNMTVTAPPGGSWRPYNDHLGTAGFVVIGLFAVHWGISVLNYRWRRYDQLPI